MTDLLLEKQYVRTLGAVERFVNNQKQEHLRDLTKAIEKESDPEHLLQLVEELCTELETAKTSGTSEAEKKTA